MPYVDLCIPLLLCFLLLRGGGGVDALGRLGASVHIFLLLTTPPSGGVGIVPLMTPCTNHDRSLAF